MRVAAKALSRQNHIMHVIYSCIIPLPRDNNARTTKLARRTKRTQNNPSEYVTSHAFPLRACKTPLTTATPSPPASSFTPKGPKEDTDGSGGRPSSTSYVVKESLSSGKLFCHASDARVGRRGRGQKGHPLVKPRRLTLANALVLGSSDGWVSG